MELVTDDTVSDAIETLNDQYGEAAKARAAHEYQSDYLKTLKARLENECNEKTQAAKERYALTHPKYLQALRDRQTLAEEDYKHRDRRYAAQAILDVWRTQTANARELNRLR